VTLAPGTRLGAYQVLQLIGSGGMGEVYSAQDTRLDRTVAIKVLPAATAADPQRRERFRREARAISRLNHPHICTLHDVGEQNGLDFLVMEHLQGETLAERLVRGALPLEQTLAISVQLADALDAAHRTGIIHRDLKPANIILTPGGVKVLDFGVAKLQADREDSVTNVAATVPLTLTAVGAVVGTVQYMAPEQVEGRPIDARADLFALGSIVYEMSTGRKAFQGASATTILAAILESVPPPMSTIQAIVPVAFDRVVRKCLEKDPAKRWQTAADLRDALEWIELDSTAPAMPTSAAVTVPAGRRRAIHVSAIVGALVAGAAIALAIMRWTELGAARVQRAAPVYRPLTFRQGLVPAARFAPDGQTMVYSAAWDGLPLELFSTRRDGVESRSLGLPTPSLIQSISRTGELAFIRNCSWIPRCRDGTLARVALAGGSPRDVLEHVSGADWSPDGRDLVIVRDVSGASRLEYPIGTVLYSPAETDLVSPRFSHSGDRIGLIEETRDGRQIAVIGLDGTHRLLTKPTDYVLNGLQWSVSDDEIWFNQSTQENPPAILAATLTGKQRLVERLPQSLLLLDIARDGSLLVNTSTPRWQRIVGRSPGDSVDRDFSVFNNPDLGDLSNDGRTFVFTGNAHGIKRGAYLGRMDGSTPVRLGDGDADALSPDGKWALTWIGNSPVVEPTGAGDAKQLNGNFQNVRWSRWFPDSRRILIDARERDHGWRGYIVDLSGGSPRAVTPEHVDAWLVSPDGRLVLGSGPDLARTAALYPVEGGPAQPVHGLESADAPVQWSSDSAVLFVRAAGPFPARVFRFNLQTGRRTLWKELMPADPAGVLRVGTMDAERNLAITPDGRAFLYKYLRILQDLFLVENLK